MGAERLEGARVIGLPLNGLASEEGSNGNGSGRAKGMGSAVGLRHHGGKLGDTSPEGHGGLNGSLPTAVPRPPRALSQRLGMRAGSGSSTRRLPLPLLAFAVILALALLSMLGSLLHARSFADQVGSRVHRKEGAWGTGLLEPASGGSFDPMRHSLASRDRQGRDGSQLGHWRYRSRPKNWQPKPGWPDRGQEYHRGLAQATELEAALRASQGEARAKLPSLKADLFGRVDPAAVSRGVHIEDASLAGPLAKLSRHFKGLGEQDDSSSSGSSVLAALEGRAELRLTEEDVWGMTPAPTSAASSSSSTTAGDMAAAAEAGAAAAGGQQAAAPQCAALRAARSIAVIGPIPLPEAQQKEAESAALVLRTGELSQDACAGAQLDVWAVRAQTSPVQHYYDGLQPHSPPCPSARAAKALWFIGGELEDVDATLAAFGLEGRPHTHFPIDGWQQRYSTRPLAPLPANDTHNYGLQPSTAWIGVLAALECADPDVQLDVYGMPLGANELASKMHDLRAERDLLLNLHHLGLVTLHAAACSGAQGDCPPLQRQQASLVRGEDQAPGAVQLHAGGTRLYPHGLKQMSSSMRLYLTSADVRED